MQYCESLIEFLLISFAVMDIDSYVSLKYHKTLQNSHFWLFYVAEASNIS